MIKKPGNPAFFAPVERKPSGTLTACRFSFDMRYPNLRYSTREALLYYASGIPRAELARRLRRSEKTIKRWLDGTERVPWYAPEILRLQQLEYQLRCYEMGMGKHTRRNQLVLLDFPVPDDAPVPVPAEEKPRRLRLIGS